MELQKLLDFISTQNKRLMAQFPEVTGNTRILAQTVKLSEEVGELSEEVLGALSLQGKHKAEKMEKDNLSKEMADVLIVTLLLANNMGVDIVDGLTKTIDKINKRYE